MIWPLHLLRRETTPSHHRSLRPVPECLEDRLLLWATNGGLWANNARITFSFVPDGTNVGGVGSSLYATLNAVAPTGNWQAAFEKAAAYWSSYANINMALVSDDGSPIGTVGNQQDDSRFGDIRIAAIPQAGGVLAYAMLPPPYNGGADAGDIVLNASINWHINTDYDLQTVALHEIGHSLGMDHSALQWADMYAYYNGVKQAPTFDDVAGIISVYGPYPADTDTNRSFASAWNLTGQIDGNSQINLPGQNIGGTGDVDYYSVTVPGTTTGTMSVSMQSSGLSSLSPRVAIYNGSKGLVGYNSLPGVYGGTATSTVAGVTPGQTYYVRASAASSLGSYGAYGLLVNFGSSPQAPIAPPNTVVPAQPSQGGGKENITQGPATSSSAGDWWSSWIDTSFGKNQDLQSLLAWLKGLAGEGNGAGDGNTISTVVINGHVSYIEPMLAAKPSEAPIPDSSSVIQPGIPAAQLYGGPVTAGTTGWTQTATWSPVALAPQPSAFASAPYDFGSSATQDSSVPGGPMSLDGQSPWILWRPRRPVG